MKPDGFAQPLERNVDITKLKIEAQDAADAFAWALNEHITKRVEYDRDGPRYAGENPPLHEDLVDAFAVAVASIVRLKMANMMKEV